MEIAHWSRHVLHSLIDLVQDRRSVDGEYGFMFLCCCRCYSLGIKSNSSMNIPEEDLLLQFQIPHPILVRFRVSSSTELESPLPCLTNSWNSTYKSVYVMAGGGGGGTHNWTLTAAEEESRIARIDRSMNEWIGTDPSHCIEISPGSGQKRSVCLRLFY